MPDRAPVALAAVASPTWAKLGGRRARQRAKRAGPHGGGGKARLAAGVQPRNLVAVEQPEHRIHVAHLDLAAHVRAAETQLTRGTQHQGERARRAHAERRPARAVRGRQGAAVPQLNTKWALRKRLRERLSQRQRGAPRAHRARIVASLVVWRSGLTRTTSQIRPTRSSARITSADGSSSQRRSPCSAEVGNAWWLLCQASPRESGASQARLRDSSPVSNRRRPKKWQSELTL